MAKTGMHGAGTVIKNMLNIAAAFPNRVEQAMYQEAQVEVTEMKRRTPVDTTPHAPHPGNLRNSIHAEEPERRGNRISVTIATGQQAPYAIHVHENPDAIHPVGQWKFMESVLSESAQFMAARVGARVHLDEK